MYNHFVQTFIDAQTAAHRHYSAVAAVEKRLFGATRSPAVRPQTVDEIQTELRRVYSTVAAHIVAKARLRPPAGDAIDCEKLFSVAGFDIERSLARGEVPDFDRLAQTLELQLGGVRAPAGEI
ncbi:hypothetical protein [Paraburkholderia sp. BCC1876]|uniref:hypothetical protein n=1 Tax=Paraburkholderia sp. BCC1876 TaxID=2676303 RepID=UPI0015929CF6|nr:hypothetical protein [Paraburkholderia sp. BCC1876]